MANTYSQLYIQLVFAVQGRESLVRKIWKDELYSYIGGIIINNQCKPLAINGMPDHIHIFIGYNPTVSLPGLVEEIKTSSNKFLKAKYKTSVFNWQRGYSAFSYSRSHVDAVIKYIMNQESHHQKHTFKEEYLKMLTDFEIEYNDNYLFDFQTISNWDI
ncbi:IS200/IS605 family transposase [Dyadobacter luteus]|jgi:putative transposase|uniref:IS200/IS605 family transposase n=1 Tax=Dyadobacter luteus TaxID=2259619 RepID=A0A3D8YD99_9BACT|nr:IS200/IS605 family transposase [Dyadobacter luteus]REA62085.1 IS200/IS605 family transposase [Dyadobacter luteus]